MGGVITQSYKYAAFISYAHADEAVAKRLHTALETYPLPKGLDISARSKLSPVFRDVAELTAHHSLNEKIRDAVKASRFLILLCSPAAKNSHWVNEEIKLFRKLHGEAAILAVIVKGKPDTAFPPALTQDGREPLAADMTSKEGFKFGVTQLAASMLGVGLDQLIRRDQKRRRLRTQLATAVSTTLALVMGGLAWTAIDARDDAEVALTKAEVSRNAAEEMVEFMIKDFKEELVPIQKLDLFESVGQRVKDYYDDIPLEDMDDDRLMRQARSLHVLGEVELDRGNYEAAEQILKNAYLISEDVYIRNPDNTDAIFAHAQSEYWMGASSYLQQNFDLVLPWYEAYSNLSIKLHELDKSDIDWIIEAGSGEINQAMANIQLGNYTKAIALYQNAIRFFDSVPTDSESFKFSRYAIADAYGGMSKSAYQLEQLPDAKNWRQKQTNTFNELSVMYPNDYDIRFRLIQSKYRKALIDKHIHCKDESLAAISQELIDLIAYEPQNLEWQKELVNHWHKRVSSCFHDGNFDSYLLEFSAFSTFKSNVPESSNLHPYLSRIAESLEQDVLAQGNNE